MKPVVHQLTVAETAADSTVMTVQPFAAVEAVVPAADVAADDLDSENIVDLVVAAAAVDPLPPSAPLAVEAADAAVVAAA